MELDATTLIAVLKAQRDRYANEAAEWQALYIQSQPALAEQPPEPPDTD